MRDRAKKTAYGAVFAALETVILYMGAIAPGGRIAMTVMAGLPSAAAMIECGAPTALAAYAVSSALALLICPLKAVPVAYALFFGFYPLLKSLIERRIRPGVQLPVKLAAMLAAEAVMLVLYRAVMLNSLKTGTVLIIFGVSAPLMIAYDFCLTRLIEYYISRKIKK